MLQPNILEHIFKDDRLQVFKMSPHCKRWSKHKPKDKTTKTRKPQGNIYVMKLKSSDTPSTGLARTRTVP